MSTDDPKPLHPTHIPQSLLNTIASKRATEKARRDRLHTSKLDSLRESELNEDDAQAWAAADGGPFHLEPPYVARTAETYRNQRIPTGDAIEFYRLGVSAAQARRYCSRGWRPDHIERLRLGLSPDLPTHPFYRNQEALLAERRWFALGLSPDRTLLYVSAGIRHSEVPDWEERRSTDPIGTDQALEMMAALLR